MVARAGFEPASPGLSSSHGSRARDPWPPWSDQLDWPLDDRASFSRSIGGDWGYFILSGGWFVGLEDEDLDFVAFLRILFCGLLG